MKFFEQIKRTSDKEKELKMMHTMVDEAIDILKSDGTLDDFGMLLDENWKVKRTLTSKITTPLVDEIYAAAKSAGLAEFRKFCVETVNVFLSGFTLTEKMATHNCSPLLFSD